MAIALLQLPALDSDSGLLNVIVDTPKGSRNKYKLDEKEGLWRLGKVLPLSPIKRRLRRFNSLTSDRRGFTLGPSSTN